MKLLACAGLGWALICAPALAQTVQTAFEPYAGEVTAARGLYVRAEARPDAPVLATLWPGARVFVRDAEGGRFVRIDGFGVAGYAYVDRAFISAPRLAAPQPSVALRVPPAP